MFKLSLIIPVYNEAKTIEKIIRRVDEISLPFDKEIVIIDDFSTDGTREMLSKLNSESIKVFFHEYNQGKGAALRTGFSKAQGDVVIIQDADLEYDPAEYPKILQPILDGKADVVYG